MTKNILTKKEAASYLNMSLSFINHLVVYKKVEYLKIGKAVRFKKEVLDNFLDSHIQRTIN